MAGEEEEARKLSLGEILNARAHAEQALKDADKALTEAALQLLFFFEANKSETFQLAGFYSQVASPCYLAGDTSGKIYREYDSAIGPERRSALQPGEYKIVEESPLDTGIVWLYRADSNPDCADWYQLSFEGLRTLTSDEIAQVYADSLEYQLGVLNEQDA